MKEGLGGSVTAWSRAGSKQRGSTSAPAGGVRGDCSREDGESDRVTLHVNFSFSSREDSVLRLPVLRFARLQTLRF